MKKKKATSSVLVRSDQTLLGLGLLGIAILLGSMFILPRTSANLSPQSGLALEELNPQAVDESFAAEPEYEVIPVPEEEYLNIESPSDEPIVAY